MRLFNAIEKCFPEMRKHRDWLYGQKPKEYWTPAHQTELKEEMILWIRQQYLDDHSIIFQLFRQAGFETKRVMATTMLIWHIYDWNIEHGLHKVSQTDTAPAQK